MNKKKKNPFDPDSDEMMVLLGKKQGWKIEKKKK